MPIDSLNGYTNHLKNHKEGDDLILNSTNIRRISKILEAIHHNFKCKKCSPTSFRSQMIS